MKPSAILAALVVLTFAISSFSAQKAHGIRSEYDKFKDRTLVYSDYMRVYGSDWNRDPLELSVQFSYPGRTASAPAGVLLYFWSATPNWRFKELPTLLAIVDQERVTLGTATNIEQDVHVDRYSVSAREYVSIIVSVAAFRKLAQANAIEMQLGPAEFKLQDRHIATFRAISSRIP